MTYGEALRDFPFNILAVRRKNRWWKLATSRAQQKLVEALCADVPCPGEILFVGLDGENKHFRSRFRKVPGAKIYSA